MTDAEFISKDADNAITLATGAASISLALGMREIYLFTMQNGGSFSLSMIPMFLFAYAFGVRRGIVVCAIVGIAEMMFDPYVVTPIQAFVDYPLAYGCLGIAGSRRLDRRAMTAVACAARLFWHVFSGVVWFAEYAPPDTTPLAYSFFYNFSYMLPSWAVCYIPAEIIAVAYEKIRRRAISRLNPSPER